MHLPEEKVNKDGESPQHQIIQPPDQGRDFWLFRCHGVGIGNSTQQLQPPSYYHRRFSFFLFLKNDPTVRILSTGSIAEVQLQYREGFGP